VPDHRRSARHWLSDREVHGGAGCEPDPAQPQAGPHREGAGRSQGAGRGGLRRGGGALRPGFRQGHAGADRRARHPGGYRPQQRGHADRLPRGLFEDPCRRLHRVLQDQHHRPDDDLLPLPARHDGAWLRPHPQHHQRHFAGSPAGGLLRQQGRAGQGHHRPGQQGAGHGCDDQPDRSRLVPHGSGRSPRPQRPHERHPRHRGGRLRGRQEVRPLPQRAPLHRHDAGRGRCQGRRSSTAPIDPFSARKNLPRLREVLLIGSISC